MNLMISKDGRRHERQNPAIRSRILFQLQIAGDQCEAVALKGLE